MVWQILIGGGAYVAAILLGYMLIDIPIRDEIRRVFVGVGLIKGINDEFR